MSLNPPTEKTDHWSSKAYSTSAAFVPQLATKITRWLDPQPSDKILDLGCGDGVLTAQIASSAHAVLGVDASASMIATAQAKHQTPDNDNSTPHQCRFRILDCRHLDRDPAIVSATFDKVFSNAALHWILRDGGTRAATLRAVYGALKPHGAFVFEMGGAGNVAEVHAALIAAVALRGVGVEGARAASPWWFPSDKAMAGLLEEAGFVVDWLEMEYRPTKLTGEEGGGLEGWVRLMGASFLELVEEGEGREEVVREVCETLESVVRHEEDGSMWLGYVRLRGVASKH